MKIVFCNGGLANQVFQYIFYRYAQINAPAEEWLLDDSFFFIHNIHNGYELEKVFNLHPIKLSQKFESDVWNYMITLKKEHNKSIPQLLLENGTDINMIVEGNTQEKWNPFNGVKFSIKVNDFNPSVILIDGNIYYHGYWINSEWFTAIKNVIENELSFPEIDEPHNIEYIKKIKEAKSCSIHIRRGDYTTLGVSLQDHVYKDAIRRMTDLVGDFTIFVFSDDIPYCKAHIHEIGLDLVNEIVFIEGNRKEKAFRDMQLMSHCKYMINGNSSFCYLASILNQNLQLMSAVSPNRLI